MLQSIRKWEKGKDYHPEDETTYTTQYQEGFRKYVENEYCAKHRRVLVIDPRSLPSNNLFPVPRLQYPVDFLSIRMICPVMMKYT